MPGRGGDVGAEERTLQADPTDPGVRPVAGLFKARFGLPVPVVVAVTEPLNALLPVAFFERTR